MSNRFKDIGVLCHVPPFGCGVTNALILESMKNDLGVIIVDELELGINISDLVEMKVKETQQIIMTINESHPIEFRKQKIKKPRWRNGKLKYL